MLRYKPGMVVHAYKYITWETEAGGLQVRYQHGPYDSVKERQEEKGEEEEEVNAWSH